LPFHGETASLVVGQAQSSGTVRRAEDSVLLDQVVNRRLLVPVDPSGEHKQEEGERRRQRFHSGSLPEGQPGFNRYRLRDPTPSDWTEGPEAKAFSDGVEVQLSEDLARPSFRT
jgi:hypothetical protein